MTQPDCTQLFVYGLLTFPVITKALTGHDFQQSEALLPGYRRFGLSKDLDAGSVPVLMADSQAEQVGVLLSGVTAEDLAILDFFEEIDGGLYRRELVRVYANQQWQNAWVYLAGPQLAPFAVGPWQPEQVSAAQLQQLAEQQIPELLQQYQLMQNMTNSRGDAPN
ncbi:gamma-glutamylcyclotransferase family protein [Rheinheimera sp.]|uniref:gamma-glutamylcyclotransferase family protein n=1 Tax=Rheinheimera sp. TaxID=1869214 RepID=UPI00307E4621